MAELRKALLVWLVPMLGVLSACGNVVEVAPAERAGAAAAQEAAPAASAVGASQDVQRLVGEIDEMLVVPQDSYPKGSDFSAMFEALLDAVIRQPRSLRTTQVVQNMGYFIANGHGIGWDPKRDKVERLARDWREFRSEVLAGP